MDSKVGRKKGRRLGGLAWIISVGAAMSVVCGMAAAGVPASASQLDNGCFVIRAISDGGEFVGEQSGSCGVEQPEQPVEPQPEEWPTIPAFSCSIKLGWPDHTLAATWDAVPGAAEYRVKATSPNATWKITSTTTETNASVKVPMFPDFGYGFITVEAVDAGGARLRISQGYANVHPGGQADSHCSEVVEPIE